MKNPDFIVIFWLKLQTNNAVYNKVMVSCDAKFLAKYFLRATNIKKSLSARPKGKGRFQCQVKGPEKKLQSKNFFRENFLIIIFSRRM